MTEYTEHEYCDFCNEEEDKMGFLDILDQRLLDDRVIMVNGDIDEVLNGRVTRSLHQLTKVNRTGPEGNEITLLISSHGGSADCCYAIVHAIEDARAQGFTITGEVRGYAMSAAAMILQHCDIRLASRDDIVMIHGPQSINVGDIRNQEADLRLTQRMIDGWVHFFSSRNTSDDPSYHSEDFWRTLLRDQIPHYFVGYEALAAGLIDELT